MREAHQVRLSRRKGDAVVPAGTRSSQPPKPCSRAPTYLFRSDPNRDPDRCRWWGAISKCRAEYRLRQSAGRASLEGAAGRACSVDGATTAPPAGNASPQDPRRARHDADAKRAGRNALRCSSPAARQRDRHRPKLRAATSKGSVLPRAPQCGRSQEPIAAMFPTLLATAPSDPARGYAAPTNRSARPAQQSAPGQMETRQV